MRATVVVADAELREPPGPQEAFGFLDAREFLLGHRQPRRNARGETRHRGLIGDREAVPFGGLAHLGFGQVVGE